MKRLVEMCWAGDYESRPEFIDVIEMLEEIAKDIKPDLLDLPRNHNRPASAVGSPAGRKAGEPVPPVANSGNSCCSLQ